MKVTVLGIVDCPNTELAQRRLAEALLELGDATVDIEFVTVHTDAEAERVAFHGSPTFLVDGIDPFPAPAGPVGLSCRVYPSGHGFDRAPSVSELVATLRVLSVDRFTQHN